MRPAIRVERLGKRYRIGAARERSDTLYDLLARALRAPVDLLGGRRAPRPRSEEFWALRAVDFEVRPGEVLGVVGRNGAGKSTLLKLLARITPPSEGRVEIVGRVASLLEVGTGFHPELTGRENVFLNGAILGMGRQEIARKFDEIVAFAEVERFLDTPVKRYSSGMYVRLAFAVAAHLEPDVLLVDEVLAVGDAEFQRKCLAKMSDVGRLGRTILFVSHNLTAVRRLCERTLLVDRGRIVVLGPTARAIDTYLASGAGEEASWPQERAPASARARLDSIRVRGGEGSAGGVSTDHPVSVEVDFALLEPGLDTLAVVVHLHDARGVDVLSSVSAGRASLEPLDWFARPHAAGRYRAACTIPGGLLNDLTYAVSAHLVTYEPFRIEASAERAVSFEVRDSGAMRESAIDVEWHGAVRPRLAWRVERLGG
jgi:lipopolysaccharide transport system ATP-binding protein